MIVNGQIWVIFVPQITSNLTKNTKNKSPRWGIEPGLSGRKARLITIRPRWRNENFDKKRSFLKVEMAGGKGWKCPASCQIGLMGRCQKVSKSAKIWLSKSIFYVKNYPNLSQFFFSLKNINLGACFLLLTFFENFNF